MPTVITRGAASAQGYGYAGAKKAANYIEDVFSTYLYTGNGSTQTITNGIDLSTKGGLVWAKRRSTGMDNALYDTARGTTKQIFSNSTAAQTTVASGLTSFGTTGFTLGSANTVNVNAETYASWTFRKQAKFFDVQTFSTDALGNATFSHSLGSTPGMIIFKCTSTIDDWYVWHTSLLKTEFLKLNLTSAKAVFGATDWLTVSSTSISLMDNYQTGNASWVAYLFAHDAGGFGAAGTDNVISCGSFTTDGSGNATVSLGYEPQWVMIKASSAVEGWEIGDNMRGLPVSGTYARLRPNLSNAEDSSGELLLTNTGFRRVGVGASVTYIYIAIRRGPMKTPTSGTSVFALQAYSDGVGGAALAGSTQSFVNLRPDLSVFANRAGSTNNFQFADLLRGYQQTTGPGADTLTTPTLKTTNSNAEATSGNAIYVLPANGSNPPEVRFSSDSVGAKLGYIFRRAPGFFDVVCYTGTGANRTVSHNLGVAPELMIVKARNNTIGYSWFVYVSALGASKVLNLNQTLAEANNSAAWNDTAPTSSVFSLGASASTNKSGDTYVAYLFGTVAGVSKVGSYTGSGTTKQIDCGFTGGARFVLIKRTDSTGDWYVWDSARGIVAGNDPYLLLNSSAAEVTGTDYVDTYSAGFEISSTAPAAINANGGSFIFLAIA